MITSILRYVFESKTRLSSERQIWIWKKAISFLFVRYCENTYTILCKTLSIWIIKTKKVIINLNRDLLKQNRCKTNFQSLAVTIMYSSALRPLKQSLRWKKWSSKRKHYNEIKAFYLLVFLKQKNIQKY